MNPEELQKTAYNALHDVPLEPTDPRYVPIYEESVFKDPVKRLKKHIELIEDEKVKEGKSVQFFSGFRGCGKTTELFRLRKELQDSYYLVIYADALKYINHSNEIDITELLIILAGAFSDALESHESIKTDIKIESYWTRFKNFLKTEVKIQEANVKTDLDFLGMAKTEASIKLNLKDTPSFRKELRDKLSTRIGKLKENVHNFVRDGVSAIHSALNPNTQIVFIFDSLEQIRGSLLNQQAVIESVEQIFSHHHRLLELPGVHTIYTVPPWLKFVTMTDNAKPIVLLHSIKQWANNKSRTSHENGRKIFRKLVVKRFGEQGFEAFFGESCIAERTKADDLIDLCGGDLRVLLRLFRELILPAETFPITDDEIKAAIARVRGDFLPISDDDAFWLAKIDKNRDVSLPDVKSENINRLTRFFDRNWVLYFRNGEDWYDIHPFIQKEVRKIVKRLQKTPLTKVEQ